MASTRSLRWLVRRDPGLAACRRALRIAIAASVAFLGCRYLVGSPTMAVYATFGVLGFGVLSDVSGTPSRRTRTLLACLVAGLVLVSVGTLLAWSTILATLGVLVVGVGVASLTLFGPRAGGVVNGLHLLYILPSFPPFAPETLPQRLLGLAVGIGLLALADRVLWPPSSPLAFPRRVAEASRAVAGELEALLVGGGPVGGGPAGETAAGAGTDRRASVVRFCAARATDRLRLGAVPLDERPTGAGACDRGLTHLAAALRTLHGRVRALDATPPVLAQVGEQAPVVLLAACVGALRRVGDALAGQGPVPELDELDRARARFVVERVEAVEVLGPGQQTVERAEAAVAVGQVAEETRIVVLATRAVLGATTGRTVVADEDPEAEPFWYASAPSWRPYAARLRCHVSLRSVYLQNALRLGLGLAVARLVAGELEVAHGFWVLLATLTLMRTSAVSTRAAMVPAVVGTAIGGVLATGLVLGVGQHPVVTAVLLPVLVLVAVLSGALIGIVAAQACFTLVIAALFSQLAPVAPTLGAERLGDVLLGAAIGVAVGAAVWPAGGHGEIRRAAARCLDTAADLVEITTAWLAGKASRARVQEQLGAMTSSLTFYESTYAQFRAERRPARGHDLDWMVVLAVVHRVARGSRAALAEPPAPDEPLPWPALAGRLRHDVDTVTGRYHDWADTLRSDPARERAVPAPCPAFVRDGLRAVADLPDRGEHPVRALRLVDAWGWLGWLAEDLTTLERVVVPDADRQPTPVS